MTRSIIAAAVAVVTFTLALTGAVGCKKQLTLEDCKARCVTVGTEQRAKCTESALICDEGKKLGDENCNKMCDGAFAKK